MPHSEEFGFSLGQKTLVSQPQISLDSGVRGIRKREGKRLRRGLWGTWCMTHRKGWHGKKGGSCWRTDLSGFHSELKAALVPFGQ